jgi:hypothetical protein
MSTLGGPEQSITRELRFLVQHERRCSVRDKWSDFSGWQFPLETPANGGLLRIGHQSLDSEMGRCGNEMTDSLPRIFEIFQFLGDSDPETGFGRDCVMGRHGIAVCLHRRATALSFLVS